MRNKNFQVCLPWCGASNDDGQEREEEEDKEE